MRRLFRALVVVAALLTMAPLQAQEDKSPDAALTRLLQGARARCRALARSPMPTD